MCLGVGWSLRVPLDSLRDGNDGSYRTVEAVDERLFTHDHSDPTVQSGKSHLPIETTSTDRLVPSVWT